MPSQLAKNDKVSFVVAKPFTSRGKEYAVGDDFPQEDARDIETFVRARFVIPVVDKLSDKPRHWHKHIRPKDEVLERLSRDRVQLRMPTEPDSDEVVNLDVLTHPAQTPDPEDEGTGEGEDQSEAVAEIQENKEKAGVEVQSGLYDPSLHTVIEVNEYLAQADAEERDRVLDAESDGRGRKGILEA